MKNQDSRYKIKKNEDRNDSLYHVLDIQTKEPLFNGTWNQCDDYVKFKKRTESCE